MRKIFIISVCLFMIFQACSNGRLKNIGKEIIMNTDSTTLYGYNRDFLMKHTRIIELKNKNAAVAIAPDWQGRVMTSTQDGDKGLSFGWINRELITSGKLSNHINAFGGEERLWLGPEGGQFSIFFSQGKDFVYDNWQTPDFIDSRSWDVVSSGKASASLRTRVSVVNYSGTRFDLQLERNVVLLNDGELTKETGISTEGLKSVAYRSDNILTNKGAAEWSRKTGLLSIWMLGMFTPSPSVVIVIPVKEGEERLLGVKVNDNYFGKISSNRLKVEGNHIFFRADGKSRGKIGIPPLRSAGVMGSFDSAGNILTLLFCKLPSGTTDYVNSAWKLQDDPYSGDAFNSYNDGPLADGTQMGPFYELETSSPAAALAPGKSLTHSQVTVHITGDRNLLNKIAVKTLGVSLKEIEEAFN